MSDYPTNTNPPIDLDEKASALEAYDKRRASPKHWPMPPDLFRRAVAEALTLIPVVIRLEAQETEYETLLKLRREEYFNLEHEVTGKPIADIAAFIMHRETSAALLDEINIIGDGIGDTERDLTHLCNKLAIVFPVHLWVRHEDLGFRLEVLGNGNHAITFKPWVDVAF